MAEHGTNAGAQRHYAAGETPCEACAEARNAYARAFRARKSGYGGSSNPPLRDRLLSRLIINPDTGCLLWNGTKNIQGYGLIKADGRRLMTHRVMYEMFAGPIPEGLQIDHLCRVRNCANVAHLEPVTCRENLMRAPTLQAINAAKTHCDRNHEFTPENTRVTSKGRVCRTCQREYDREYQARRRASR